MNEFDFVGTGGFIIECQNGECLGVTKDQADVMREGSVFFQKCFEHEMLERKERRLIKPDWTLAISRHLVEALTKGWTTLSSLELYQHVMAAADQALIDLRLCNFVNYMDATQCQDTRFLELVSDTEKYYCFDIKSKITSVQWIQLLEVGILLNRERTNYVVQVAREKQSFTQDQLISRKNLDTKFSEYRIHADRSLQALMEIQKTLADGPMPPTCTSSANRTEEKFAIYFERIEDSWCL